jgi:hypothetical protein
MGKPRNLIGLTAVFTVSDPWDLMMHLNQQRLKGRIERSPSDNTAAVLKLARPVRLGVTLFIAVELSPRHAGQEFTRAALASGLPCNGVLIGQNGEREPSIGSLRKCGVFS